MLGIKAYQLGGRLNHDDARHEGTTRDMPTDPKLLVGHFLVTENQVPFSILPKYAVKLLHFKTLGVDLVDGRLVVDRLSMKVKKGKIEEKGRRH